jgi:hypothetical protein
MFLIGFAFSGVFRHGHEEQKNTAIKFTKNALQINAVMGGELLGTAGQGRRY